MIGEIGGQLEADAAKWIKADGNRKPVVGFIAGETAPKGRTMGHAGAIVGGADDTAEAKKRIMKECGIHVVDSPAEIGKKVKEALLWDNTSISNVNSNTTNSSYNSIISCIWINVKFRSGMTTSAT
jgi:succinyl-CoA synthetase alpha subunit